jgi:hypothetical protein
MPPEAPEDDRPEEDGNDAQEPLESEGKPPLSYPAAMIAYAVLGIVCLVTLRNDALYIALLIIGALALKTWLARVKSRLE